MRYRKESNPSRRKSFAKPFALKLIAIANRNGVATLRQSYVTEIARDSSLSVKHHML